MQKSAEFYTMNIDVENEVYVLSYSFIIMRNRAI